MKMLGIITLQLLGVTLAIAVLHSSGWLGWIP